MGRLIEFATAHPWLSLGVVGSLLAALFNEVRLRAAGVEFLEYHALRAVRPGAAEVTETLTGDVRTLPADSVVGAAYGIADDALFGELLAACGDSSATEVHAVGDCLAPRQAIDAIWDAFRVARAI